MAQGAKRQLNEAAEGLAQPTRWENFKAFFSRKQEFSNKARRAVEGGVSAAIQATAGLLQ